MKYPIGIQNFEKIITSGYVYVDKTALIYRLVTEGNIYFLSRPRRFGKSLLVSTLEAYFKGKKDLFKGLAIDELEKEWTEHPVFHIDFNGENYTLPGKLEEKIMGAVETWEAEYGRDPYKKALGDRFIYVLAQAAKKHGRRAVVLIDEYDKPIVDNLGNPELADDFKKTLQGFYSVLKAKDGQIRFGFLTGVSKIGKLSVFSGLNNLRDISMLPEYSDICGISENDLHKYFDESVAELANSNQFSKDECYSKLKNMYDGYHFSEESVGMYNPFSLLNTFSSNRFREYWFETGTPTLLVNVMKQTSFDVTTLSDVVVASDDLSGGKALCA